MQVYIHYGSDTYDPDDVLPIRNSGWQTKPEGGLWASREDDEYGWKEWCEDNHFYTSRLKHFFRFTLSESARILVLNTPEDLVPLPKLHPWEPKDYMEVFTFEEEHPGEKPTLDQLNRWLAPNLCCPDFEKLSTEYDAVELRNAGAFHDCLAMWDCNSVIVFRPEVMELV